MAILERTEHQNTPQGDFALREFHPGDEAAFRQLNEEWIVRYFKLEPADEHVLQHPREEILEKGGRIFFAVRGGSIVGCCALLAMGPGEFEVAKLAVAPYARGGGIGRRLVEGVVEAARLSGVKRLYLETNHALTPAIRLYKAVGFERVPAERLIPSPYERADVFMEMLLQKPAES